MNPTSKTATVDKAIREGKIFTAIAEMPEDFQNVLLENGWIGKLQNKSASRHSSEYPVHRARVTFKKSANFFDFSHKKQF